MPAHIQELREMHARERGVLLPCAPNALAARLIADLGFKAVYLTGAAPQAALATARSAL